MLPLHNCLIRLEQVLQLTDRRDVREFRLVHSRHRHGMRENSQLRDLVVDLAHEVAQFCEIELELLDDFLA